MRTFDNQGKLKAETNTTFTQDGKVVTINTVYRSSGQPVSQSISVRDAQGTLSVRKEWPARGSRRISKNGGFPANKAGLPRICRRGHDNVQSTTP